MKQWVNYDGTMCYFETPNIGIPDDDWCAKYYKVSSVADLAKRGLGVINELLDIIGRVTHQLTAEEEYICGVFEQIVKEGEDVPRDTG